MAKKKKEMVKVKALTYILYDKEYKKGEEFEIEKEYAEGLVKNKSAEILEDVEENEEEDQEEETGEAPEGGE